MDYLLMFFGLAICAFSIMLLAYGFFGGKPLLTASLAQFTGVFLFGTSIMIGLLGLEIHDRGWRDSDQGLFLMPPIFLLLAFFYAVGFYINGARAREVYHDKRTPEWLRWWLRNWDVPDVDWSGLRKLRYRFRVWERRRALKRR